MDGIGKSRKSNFELMRIIAMLMIVLWHVIIYGNILGIYYNSFMSSLFSFLKFFLVIYVNLFMLLTGYFQISTKFKFSKIIKIISQLIFYNTVK